jgi:WD40 repeat protein
MRAAAAILIVLLCQDLPSTAAAEADADAAMRVLRLRCVKCHNPDKRKGELVMTNRQALLKGGETDAGAVPGDSSKSLMIELLAQDADPHMPPKKQLAPDEVKILSDWVNAKLPWNADVLAAADINRAVALKDFPRSYTPITALAASPDGKLAAAAHGNRIDLYDVSGDDIKPVRSLDGHRDTVRSLVWRNDSKTLISGGFRRITEWDTETGGVLRAVEDELVGRVSAMAFNVDHGRLFIADCVPAAIGRLQVRDGKTLALKRTIDAHTDSILALAVRPDGKQLASGGADKIVKLWDPNTWVAPRRLEAHTGYVLTLAYSPDSDQLGSAGDDGAVKVWNLETHKQVSSFGSRKPTGAVTDLIWRRDPAQKPQEEEVKDWIVVSGEDKALRLFTEVNLHEGGERSEGAKRRDWAAGPGSVTRLTFVVGKNWVLAGTEDGKLAAWSKDGKVVKTAD